MRSESMRLSGISLILMALLSSCISPPPSARVSELPNRAVAVVEPATPANPPLENIERASARPTPDRAIRQARVTTATHGSITFRGVGFDDRSHRLQVLDQARGPGSVVSSAAEAAQSLGGIAASNAGFFTPEGDPLGWVVSDHSLKGSSNPSSLGSGIWFDGGDGLSRIVRRGAISKANLQTASAAIQAGPMLVERSSPVTGLESSKRRVRVLLATDGRHRWWMGQTTACSLAELARVLAEVRLDGFRVVDALNLDGGSSADLWVSSRVSGGPLQLSSFLSRPVRNFLVLVPR